ncbi:hypothetical protein C6497_04140 [Candidatus Poribacteria bacterium]|nr:MAG: hypothetical protein C6497_04140 [Candidatus Poribacteria bacterium]
MKYRRCILYLLLCVLVLNFSSISHAQDNTYSEIPEGAIGRLGKGSIIVMKFSPDGKHLAVGTTIGVWLYDVDAHSVIRLKPTKPREVDNKEFRSENNNDTWNPSDVSTVNHLTFSSDNRILAASESSNRIIQLWDVDTGQQLYTLPLTMKRDSVSAIAFSDENNKLIAPTYFGEIIHWDITTGRLINKIDRHRPDLTLIEENNKPGNHFGDIVAFSKDSKTFVSGDPKEGQIRLWDAITGQQLGIFKPKTRFKRITKIQPGPLKGVNVLVFSPNGKNIACGHDDNTIRLYDTVTKTEIAVFKGHQERINTIVYSPDSSKLVSSSTDNTIRFWDIDKKREISKILSDRSQIFDLAFSPDGDILASSGDDGTIRFLDPNSGRELKIFATGHISSTIGLAFTEDNKRLVSAAYNGSVHIWEVMNGTVLPSPNVEHFDKTVAFAFSADATLFASHGADTGVWSSGSNIRTSWLPLSETHIWSLPHGQDMITFPNSYKALAFSPDKQLLAASKSRETHLWDVQKRQELYRIDVRQFPTDVVVRFSPDGKTFTTGGINGEVHIWDVESGDKISTLSSGLREYSRDIAYSPDNSILAVSYLRDYLKLWNLKTKKEMYTLLTTKDKVWIERILFSPDCKTLLVTTRNFKTLREIRLFDVESRMELPPIRTGHTRGIRTLVFSHGGKTLATGAADGTILLWDWEKINKKISIGN